MKLGKKEKMVYFVLILTLIMVNPPILNLVNDYAKENPLLWKFPTLWIWLQLWYLVGIITFLIGAISIKNWKREY